jgi:hypothetical protein
MKVALRSVALSVVAVLGMGAGTAFATAFGPTSYLQASDSPFVAFSFDYFYLENFEDHLLNTPGVTGLSGGVTSVVFGPAVHDSVDADDGTIDGSGLQGDSWFNSGASTGFSFNPALLGGLLPTDVGLVWTDGPFSTAVTFQAFAADGSTLVCNITGSGFANNSFNGETAEDRFFGCADPGGISKVTMTNALGGGIEVDHLQYGHLGSTPVPEPATLTLFGIGGVAALLRRRRNRA